MRVQVLGLFGFGSLFLTVAAIKYPEVRRDESILDTYYGVQVKDPYRWLEDPHSQEVEDFVNAQNKLTADYVDQPIRKQIQERLIDAYNYARSSVPEKQGSRYFFYQNSGTQNQE